MTCKGFTPGPSKSREFSAVRVVAKINDKRKEKQTGRAGPTCSQCHTPTLQSKWAPQGFLSPGSSRRKAKAEACSPHSRPLNVPKGSLGSWLRWLSH